MKYFKKNIQENSVSESVFDKDIGLTPICQIKFAKHFFISA